MKKRKELKIVVLIVLVVCVGLFGFDQYMKATWDHHIVGEARYGVYIKKSGAESWRIVYGDEAEKYEKTYPRMLEIKKQGNTYILKSYENLKLNRTEELDPISLRRPKNVRFRRHIFSSEDKTVKITIRANKYEVVGCSPNYPSGGTSVYWLLENGDTLRYDIMFSKYEGFINRLSCTNWTSYFLSL